jgi:glycerate kinase
MTGMHVLVAADSFKEALPVRDVCDAIARGLRQRPSAVQVTTFPLADGGEGTLSVLAERMALSSLEVDAVDPLTRHVRASVGLSNDGSIAVIEAATVCGLGLLTPTERSPLRATTQGLGHLLHAATAAGVSRVVLTVGGTATNDGGIGMAHALGWRFLDAHGASLSPSGATLAPLARIVPPSIPTPPVAVDVLCDVANPLFGPHGAAHVYARQKGANDADIDLLDNGLRNLARCVAEQVTRDVDPNTPGAGAAGGLGFGAMVFLNARLQRGIDAILDLTEFDGVLAKADVVITGEGRIDGQTLHGKLIHGICRRAQRIGKPTIALCGELRATDDELRQIGLHAAHCINEGFPRENALQETATRLTHTATRVELPSL